MCGDGWFHVAASHVVSDSQGHLGLTTHLRAKGPFRPHALNAAMTSMFCSVSWCVVPLRTHFYFAADGYPSLRTSVRRAEIWLKRPCSCRLHSRCAEPPHVLDFEACTRSSLVLSAVSIFRFLRLGSFWVVRLHMFVERLDSFVRLLGC